MNRAADTSLISWNPVVSVLLSPSANCARSFSRYVRNARDQQMDSPFLSPAANLFLPLNPLLEEISFNSLQALTNLDL
jgi:hypothetical protein